MEKKNKKMYYGNAIEYYRKRKGYSMLFLSQKLGYTSKEMVVRWERGDFVPSKENMAKLLKALDVTFEELFPKPIHNSELKLKHKDELIQQLKDSLRIANNQITELTEKLYPTQYNVEGDSDKIFNID